MAGYSGTPLPVKLGIRVGQRVVLHGVPRDVMAVLSAPLRGCRTTADAAAPIDLALIFVTTSRDLDAGFRPLARSLAPGGMIWVAWPKKASAVPTEVDENAVRATGLREGLVDVKVCAISSTWSGLKFVRRTKDRPARAAERSRRPARAMTRKRR
jgi:hypothetical protein